MGKVNTTMGRLKDDDPRYVKEVRLISKKGKKEETKIIIEEV